VNLKDGVSCRSRRECLRTLRGQDLLLALDQRHHPPKLSELRTQVERLRAAAQMAVIYATDALASYEKEAGAALSPATQAVLITLLLSKPWRNDWVLAEIVAQLG
jgi:hypothetical protein